MTSSLLRDARRRRAWAAASILAACAGPLLAATPLRAQPTPEGCEALAATAGPRLGIVAATVLPAGPFTAPSGSFSPPAGTIIPGLPAFCRVVGTLRPTPASEIGYEVWLPRTGWNGRYLQVGNGGLAGTIFYSELADGLRRGFAVAATDNGHRGSPLDGSWAVGQPERVVDFGYRAVHRVAIAGKRITAAHYGTAAGRAYFRGCSEGGREALMAAQRYPEDFDGIIAGAAAQDFTGTLARFAWNQQGLLRNPGAWIPPAKLPAVQAASLAACDALDGVSDGIVADPRRCRWDPATIQCPTGTDAADCLTPPQVRALSRIYAGPISSATGERLALRDPRSGENTPTFLAYVVGPAPRTAAQYLFARAFLGGVVYGDTSWDIERFDFDADLGAARARVGGIIDAVDPDLSAFRDRGGKLIQYHGWLDHSPDPAGAVRYRGAVLDAERASGGARGASARLAGYYRLFMAPGMGHCATGPGPNAFGQLAAAPAPAIDPTVDVLAALDRWVEQGIAPGAIIATKYVNDVPAQGIAGQRPLCPYPQVARYLGQGSTNEARNFACVREPAPE